MVPAARPLIQARSHQTVQQKSVRDSSGRGRSGKWQKMAEAMSKKVEQLTQSPEKTTKHHAAQSLHNASWQNNEWVAPQIWFNWNAGACNTNGMYICILILILLFIYLFIYNYLFECMRNICIFINLKKSSCAARSRGLNPGSSC